MHIEQRAPGAALLHGRCGCDGLDLSLAVDNAGRNILCFAIIYSRKIRLLELVCIVCMHECTFNIRRFFVYCRRYWRELFNRTRMTDLETFQFITLSTTWSRCGRLWRCRFLEKGNTIQLQGDYIHLIRRFISRVNDLAMSWSLLVRFSLYVFIAPKTP